jgi:hypothetical protein
MKKAIALFASAAVTAGDRMQDAADGADSRQSPRGHCSIATTR